MQEGELVRIEITVRVPIECSREDFEEWVEFETGYNGCLSGTNPLIESGFEVEDISF